MNAAGSTCYSETKDYGAQSGTLGSGCAGTNGVPALSAVDAPRLGQTYTLHVTNRNPTCNLAFLAFGFTQLPGLDLGAPLGMTGCLAYQSADLLVAAPTGFAGAASWSWAPVTAPFGGIFYCQALCLDPTVNAFGFTISNGVSATVGYGSPPAP